MSTISKPNTVIHIENLSHRYGNRVAVSDVNFEMPERSRICIVGPDGVGKSTLLGIIAGLRKIQTGTVRVLDGDMRHQSHRTAACSRIAYMPQGLGQNLYATLSVFENVDFFARLFGLSGREKRERIEWLLDSTRLLPFADRPAGKLSGGMKQKLGLCCALIHDPEILILDEPTTGVDPLSRRQFWELIDEMADRLRRISILVATAYMEEAERFDRLLMMDNGKILADSRPSALKTDLGCRTIEEAYIKLLPPEKRLGHRFFQIPSRVSHAGQIAIEAKHLTKKFGDFTAVDDVSFSIEKGEIFGFLGSNGCGKTTTMKMLTGLLHPTEGKALVFQDSVETGSIELRKRIGYMSQSFSLYGELTVLQNLELHARLFDLPNGEIQRRVDKMAETFELRNIMDEKAGDLPLGIRQRLSLAVAVIHEPEILILDEPTSGVDPVARDQFWEFLIELSRKKGVTIFITTHYMNEAGRCDRVALMSAGRVLACKAPDLLAKDCECESLEDAFITFIRKDLGEDIGTREEPKPDLTFQNAGSDIHANNKQRRVFNFRRLAALARRETLELMRDPLRFIFAILVAPFLLVIFGYGISTDVEKIRYSVLDRDQTPASRTYLENFSGSRYFHEEAAFSTYESMEKSFQRGDFTVAIEIPPGFEKDLKRGRQPEIGVWIDGTMPFRAEAARHYIEAVHLGYLMDFSRKFPKGPRDFGVRIEPRYLYNQAMKSCNAIVPGLLAVVMIIVPAMLTAVGVVREKELGSITNLYASPVTKLEFLLGKQIPYVVMNLFNFLIMAIMVLEVFGISFKGSSLALIAGAFLYIMASTGLGLLVSTFTQTQMAALVAAFVVTMIPAFQFSGLFSPVSSLVGSAKWMATLYPAAYFLNIGVGTFTKAIGFRELLPNYLVLSIMILVLETGIVLLLRKQEK
jgi:ribosome-dependent ATPase